MPQEKITLPTIKKISQKENSAIFSISPLFPGYGVTLGNALRRVLFSSLPGAAITAIKISGASHEFATLAGVKEDVIQIILNLKQVRIKLHQGTEATLNLNVKGPRVVEAKDIKVPSQVEITNPELEIAHLEKNGKIIIEIKVDRGLGYLPVEAREDEKKPVETILVDANYSPISGVNYTIEHTRVGTMTNYDKLLIEITTDGTIEPEKALKEAGKILLQQFELISRLENKPEKTLESQKKTTSKTDVQKIAKTTKIEEAGFSARTTNALINFKIKTLGGLARLSDEKLNQIKGLGTKGIREIKDISPSL